MNGQLDLELLRLVERYPHAAVNELPGGVQAASLGPVAVPDGWNTSMATPIFVVPSGYPASQPDCFYIEEVLLLADGRLPQNSGRQVLGDRELSWFSWHLQSWRPGKDDLLAYARFIEQRLADVR